MPISNGFPDGGGGGRSSRNTALAFAFDSGYLVPFKVLARSLMDVGTLTNNPVHIYSDDPSVFEDPFVRSVCDKPVLLTGARRDELYELARTSVGRQRKRAKWNRDTFLKWAVFSEANEDEVLFLDVDMICTGPIEPLLDLHPEADLVVASQFQHKQLLWNGRDRANRAQRAERFARLIEAPPERPRVNSGVMLLRKRLLSDDVLKLLVEHARKRRRINEQLHITSFFAENSDYRLAHVGARFNFQESYLRYVSRRDARELAKKISILHYAGPQKPWKLKPMRSRRPTIRIWYDARRRLSPAPRWRLALARLFPGAEKLLGF